jgi:ADP-ribose pyrophosphatase YjhB (NUDIX family)
VGVGAVVVSEQRILLVKRGSEPGKSKWSVPGGLVELGERVSETVIREVKEETNLDVKTTMLIDVVDNLELDEEGKCRYHFVIIDFLARLKGGRLQAGSDVLEARWVPFDLVETQNLTEAFRRFFERNRQKLLQFDSTKS